MRKLLLEGLKFESAIYPHLNLRPKIMTTSSANEGQISICEHFFFRSATVDNFLAEVPALGMVELLNFPALREETQDLDNTVEQDLPYAQDGHHPVPGPENGDPVNEQILQGEHRDVEAARVLLGLAIANNAITALHYRRIIQNLQDKLLQGGHHEILHRDLYAQVLLRLVERLMNCPSQQDLEYVPDPEYVPYSRPRNYVECLGMLLTDMAEGFFKMGQTGMEDEVYISKNMEIHTDHLSSLASRLRGA